MTLCYVRQAWLLVNGGDILCPLGWIKGLNSGALSYSFLVVSRTQKDEYIQDKKVNLTRVKIYDLLLCFLVTMIVFDTTCLYRKFPI